MSNFVDGIDAKSNPAVHYCCTAGCKNAATMACPTCLKLGLAPSRFCSQVNKYCYTLVILINIIIFLGLL